jgi:hypothetical protein
MKTLQSVEDSFQRYVLRGETGIAAAIAGTKPDVRAKRLQIYYDAYRLRLAEVLESDFETLRGFLGSEAFGVLARAYVDAHPSVFHNVRWFGQKMAEFLRIDAAYSDQPILSELAAFEWALGLSFDADDAPVLTFKELSALPPDDWTRVRFRMHPSFHTLSVDWNVIAIWNAIAGEQTPPVPTREPATQLAIWRQGHTSHFRTLPMDEARLIGAAANGSDFPELCEQLVEEYDDQAPTRAATLLRTWVDDGWLTGYSLAKPA